MRLLIRPHPIPHESAQGYVCRIAELNAVTYPRWLQSLSTARAESSAQVHPLKALVEHERGVPGNLRGPVSNLGRLNAPDPGALHSRFWNTGRPRYCPSCLVQSGHWRGIWDLAFVVACPIHGARLIDVCLGCGQALSWNRRSVLSCSCGADLREASVVESNTLSWCLSTAIVARLQGATEYDDDKLPYVRDLSAEQLLRLIWFLGGYGAKPGSKAQKIAGLANLNIAERVVQEAALALLDWPAGFYCLLDRIAASHGKLNGGNRLAKSFGRFYPSLYKTFPEPVFAFLSETFETYISNRWEGQLAGRNRRLSESMRVQHDWVPTTHAARALAVSVPTIRGFVERGLLVGRLQQTTKGRVMGAVSKPSLEKLLIDKQHWVTLKTVQSKYGLSRQKGHALIKELVLKPISGPSVDGRPVWLFDERDLEKLNLSNMDKSHLRMSNLKP